RKKWGEINVKSELGKGSKFWFTWNVELLSIALPLLNTQFDQMIEDARNAMLKYFKSIKVDAFDTFDKGIRAAKEYKELNNQSD
ncbi:13906_t:CDS:2, partial [Racocetra persica]